MPNRIDVTAPATITVLAGSSLVSSFNALPPGGITLGNAAGAIAVTLTAANGGAALSASGLGGATISGGGGTITLAGTQAQVNAALATLEIYEPAAAGSDTILFAATGANIVAKRTAIAVDIAPAGGPAFVAPPATLSLHPNTLTPITGLVIGDPGAAALNAAGLGAEQTLALTLSADSGLLFLPGFSALDGIEAAGLGTGTIMLDFTADRLGAIATLIGQRPELMRGDIIKCIVSLSAHGFKWRIMKTFNSFCPICSLPKTFSAVDDYGAGRDGLSCLDCPLKGCVTRERAIAFVLRTEYSESFLLSARIHESSPAERGIAEWFRSNCPNYLQTAFFQNTAPGTMVGILRNEDLENQTFPDRSFDIVIHLDVMEHLFNPFVALREIYRTLVHGGKCIFTAPTYPDQLSSLQVAFRNEDGTIDTVGVPEYHGNPQSAQGSLLTWRYGYDLPLLISRESNFDIEVRRFQSRRAAATGIMTEVYILTK